MDLHQRHPVYCNPDISRVQVTQQGTGAKSFCKNKKINRLVLFNMSAKILYFTSIYNFEFMLYHSTIVFCRCRCICESSSS